jgi:hypothetical protein
MGGWSVIKKEIVKLGDLRGEPSLAVTGGLAFLDSLVPFRSDYELRSIQRFTAPLNYPST